MYDEYEGPAADPIEGAKVKAVLEYSAEHFMGEVASRAASQLLDSCRRNIETEVMKRVTVEIDRQINEIVSATLDKSFQPIDQFGDAAGAPTTVRAIIAKKAESFMNEKVDAYGKAASHYNTSCTRAEWLLKNMAGEAIDAQAKKEIEAIAKSAKQEANAKVAKLLLDAIQKA